MLQRENQGSILTSAAFIIMSVWKTDSSLNQSVLAIEFGASLRYLLSITLTAAVGISLFSPLSMPPDLNGSLQTQMAVAAIRGPLNGELSGNKGMEGKTSSKIHVFVQTETGSVLCLELDRTDNAQIVKKRLQKALNVPTKESSLTYGDMVLKNDLSSVRNDSPLLLTRYLMHRSSSTPCLSPTGRNFQHTDQSGPIEILGCSNPFSGIKNLVKDIVKALDIGIDPIPICSVLEVHTISRILWVRMLLL